MVEKKVEEKKSGIWRVIAEVIVQTLVSSLIVAAIAFVGTYFMLEQGSVNVSGSVPIDNQFLTVISVENFKKTSLSELALCIDEKINVLSVHSEKYVEVQDQYLNLSKIPPKSMMSIIVYSDKEICATDVYVDSPDKIVVYAGLMESPSWISVWKQIKPMVVSVSLGVFIALCLQEYLNQKLQIKLQRKIENAQGDFDRKTEELEKELTQSIEESEELEEKVSQTNNKCSELEEQVRKTNKRCSELKVYYVQRISAQKKELAFWKDTIRKFIYLNSKNIDEADKLFEVVTSTLKTYAARDQVYENFDEIQYIAEQIAKDKREQRPDEE